MAKGVQLIYFLSCIIGLCGAECSVTTYSIQGAISAAHHLTTGHEHWLKNAHIHVNNGEFVGVPGRDGQFVVTGLPSGSYVVEVSHPALIFESFRVEINKKGKIRARKLNNIQPGKIETVVYPLAFKAKGKAPYFQKREEWKITDALFSPVVPMLLMALLTMVVMPKMMNMTDPEVQREFQSHMGALQNPGQQLPNLSEWLVRLFGVRAPQTDSQRNKKRKR